MDALVDNTSTPPPRFYCHTCAAEIENVSSEFTCPRCSQGFIEELPAVDRSSTSGPPSGQDFDQPSNDYGNTQFSNEQQAIRLAGEIFSTTFLSPFFRNPNDAREGESSGASSGAGNGDHAMFTLEDIPNDGGSQPSSASGTSGPNSVDNGEGAAGGSGGNGTGSGGVTLFGGDPRPSMRFPGRRGSRRRGMQNINHVDHILREILISVSGGANGGVAAGPMLFMGNPGDYAWGREGIDTIVTQLLNQMDNTGPPPLEKERIAEIPTVTINAEQVERKLQCSVCFEDFVIDEAVRKLPCLHVYHEPCIIPWLELHGTCPICRKSLTPEQSQGSPQSQSQQTQDNSSSPEELSEPSPQQQEQRQGQQTSSSSQSQDGDRQNPNFVTFTIRPSMTNLLYEMGQPTAVPVSSSSLPQGSRSAPGTASATSGAGSSSRRTNASDPSSSSGAGASDQPGNSNRDDDGNIDYTLD